MDFLFQDDIPIGTTFVDGSVKIDGIAYPTFNPQNGFALPNLVPLQSTTVEFKVTID